MSEMRDSDSCSGSHAGLNGFSREWSRVKPAAGAGRGRRWRWFWVGGGVHSFIIYLPLWDLFLFSPPLSPTLWLSHGSPAWPLRPSGVVGGRTAINWEGGGHTAIERNAAQAPIFQGYTHFFCRRGCRGRRARAARSPQCGDTAKWRPLAHWS